ncbi:hypothetical protein MIMGU_mgv1a012907mg [Erythranthe guttata]|uniref:Uncharacterized protein n=1 Tax=Erythranthe guttata TaxID=4155 RepID=A0A022QQF6_ERYGU|nr:hypothetical protein MIMGU_mgv1a012907mg [Erythranthe guttata]
MLSHIVFPMHKPRFLILLLLRFINFLVFFRIHHFGIFQFVFILTVLSECELSARSLHDTIIRLKTQINCIVFFFILLFFFFVFFFGLCIQFNIYKSRLLDKELFAPLELHQVLQMRRVVTIRQLIAFLQLLLDHEPKQPSPINLLRRLPIRVNFHHTRFALLLLDRQLQRTRQVGSIDIDTAILDVANTRIHTVASNQLRNQVGPYVPVESYVNKVPQAKPLQKLLVLGEIENLVR